MCMKGLASLFGGGAAKQQAQPAQVSVAPAQTNTAQATILGTDSPVDTGQVTLGVGSTTSKKRAGVPGLGL